ncbi:MULTISPECIES: HNH endonuclease [unclassified Streptomyces]|uniref:HNH endonuclease n=1 Tax=unclassified Streptomyces TaxID=2593676 RepID=UPI0038251E17
MLAGATPVLVHNCNRGGLDFTDTERQKVYDANAAKNGGEYRCDYCGQKVERRGSRDADGNPVPGRPDDAQIDHIEPRAGGGHGGAHNGAVACRRCNRDKSTKTMEDWDDELRDFLDP